MQLASWNVNGIRAAWDKGFAEYLKTQQPDVLCLQEVKANQDQVDLSLVEELGYSIFWNGAVKKGYSGTAILTKVKPKSHSLGLGLDEHDQEGRVLTLDFGDYYLTTVYTPNSKRGLTRLDYRQIWDQEFLSCMMKLDDEKPVIFCGDLNCAHKEIDLANPKTNRRNAGFTDEERAGVDNILEAGFRDSFREFDDSPGKYTWWSMRMPSLRERNVGWRLDYFFVSDKAWDRVKGASILPQIFGSDHCPVTLEID